MTVKKKLLYGEENCINRETLVAAGFRALSLCVCVCVCAHVHTAMCIRAGTHVPQSGHGGQRISSVVSRHFLPCCDVGS